jgi:glucan phosphoethanolaminetransferase (alkaline phosphatase superfamily)
VAAQTWNDKLKQLSSQLEKHRVGFGPVSVTAMRIFRWLRGWIGPIFVYYRKEDFLNTKTLCKLIIDLVMTVLILVAMACRFTGNTIHELLGVSLFILFVIHNILNWRWFKTLLKGRYNVLRVLHTAVNLLLLAAMLVLIVSGVMLSRTVFAFMDLNGGLFARKLHMLSTYWGFLLISVHLGMHWGMIMNAARKLANITAPNRNRTFTLRIMAVLIAIYGVYASFNRDVGSKLILYYAYDFWNFDQSPVFFFVDYLSIMGLYVCVTYYTVRLIQRSSSKKISS